MCRPRKTAAHRMRRRPSTSRLVEAYRGPEAPLSRSRDDGAREKARLTRCVTEHEAPISRRLPLRRSNGSVFLSLSLTCAYLLVRHSPSYPSHGCPPRVRAYPGRRGRAGDQGRKKADRVLGRRRCGDQRVGDVARRPTSRRPIRTNATRLHPRAQKMALRCSTQQQQQRQQKQQRRVQYARSFARSLVSSLAPSLRRHSAGAAARLHRTPSGGATIARGAAKFQNRTRRLSSSFHCKCKLFPLGVINVRKIVVQSLYLFTYFFILFSIVYFSL